MTTAPSPAALTGADPLNGDTPPTKAEPALLDHAADALVQVDRLLVRLWIDALADGAPPGTHERITDATRFVRLARMSLTAAGGELIREP